MGKPIPDDALEVIGEEWNKLGYTTIITWRLIERGLTMEDVDWALQRTIGKDWHVIKAGVWIDRLAAAGNEDILRSIKYDNPPLTDIIEKLVRTELGRRDANLRS